MATHYSISSYSALKARQKHTTKKLGQLVTLITDFLMKISRARITGTNHCAKCPTLSDCFVPAQSNLDIYKA
jgi:hypothetical protein